MSYFRIQVFGTAFYTTAHSVKSDVFLTVSGLSDVCSISLNDYISKYVSNVFGTNTLFNVLFLSKIFSHLYFKIKCFGA
jgi:hypothetical protein